MNNQSATNTVSESPATLPAKVSITLKVNGAEKQLAVAPWRAAA